SGQAVFLTGLALGRLINSQVNHAPNVSNIAIFTADLAKVELSDAKLRDVFLAGRADNVSFRGAELAGANLRGLEVVRSDFALSNLNGAILPENMMEQEYAQYLGGADWW